MTTYYLLLTTLPYTQGSAATADANASGVTDTGLLELREGLFAIIATGQAAILVVQP